MDSKSLARYFQKTGTLKLDQLDYNFLKHLQRTHLETFAFEGCNPLLGQKVSLDPQKLIDKFLNHPRGGYCFEQNLFFKDVLISLGYEVNTYLGRVIESNSDFGRTHLVNVVLINSDLYLVDVGFGGYNSPEPLLIHDGFTLETNLNTYRIKQVKSTYFFQAWINDEWENLYSFDFNIYTFGDYEVANWYTSTNPNTTFTQSLNIAIIDGNFRYHLKNDTFSILKSGHYIKKETIQSLPRLQEILERYFKINPSYLPGWHQKINEILAFSKK